ncbi:hypothetical protein HX747_30845 [Streptomyces sp. L06]|nr:hypothetical protein [Streptomyces sp. L06]
MSDATREQLAFTTRPVTVTPDATSTLATFLCHARLQDVAADAGRPSASAPSEHAGKAQFHESGAVGG